MIHDREASEQQAGVGGATGATVTGGIAEGGQQAHRRRSAGAQLLSAQPDERVGDADGNRVRMVDSGATFIMHSQPDGVAPFRSAGGQRPSVARNGHWMLSVTVVLIMT